MPRDLAAILDFMYHGEVNVKQDHLNSFLAVAERLKVRGLCQNDGGSSSGSKAATPQVEKPKSRVMDLEVHHPRSLEPQAKRPRPSLPAAPAVAEDDEVEELPPPQVKVEEGAEAPHRRGSAQHFPGGEAPHHSYPMAETGYDENLQGSEYGDYSGYDEELGYMEGGGGGVDPTQGTKGKAVSSLYRAGAAGSTCTLAPPLYSTSAELGRHGSSLFKCT